MWKEYRLERTHPKLTHYRYRVRRQIPPSPGYMRAYHPDKTVAWQLRQVFDSSPAILAVSPFAMERQLYSLATHGATS
jgi:hypothetical protein